ncbi:hypothetical protein KBY76_12790, partial [Synechococcus sp. GreenBA-s]|nr:hypothetical protein [Synechococcus sp. GreenBA-s]
DSSDDDDDDSSDDDDDDSSDDDDDDSSDDDDDDSSDDDDDDSSDDDDDDSSDDDDDDSSDDDDDDSSDDDDDDDSSDDDDDDSSDDDDDDSSDDDDDDDSSDDDDDDSSDDDDDDSSDDDDDDSSDDDDDDDSSSQAYDDSSDDDDDDLSENEGRSSENEGRSSENEGKPSENEGRSPKEFKTPVVLDLNHDGTTEFLSRSEGVTFDYGEGSVGTAWAGPEDGILAYDYNADGLVTDAKEFVFSLWDPQAVTDLQGLALHFDTNTDGVLDANDSAFGSFGVWQDSNSDGITDSGEFSSLADLGITAIYLAYSPDSSQVNEAGGDVIVYGQSAYVKADGTTGLVADAGFAVDSPSDNQPVTDQPAGLPAAEVEVTDLIGSFLELIHSEAVQDAGVQPSTAELAHGLDQVVSNYISTHGLSADDFAAIHDDVLHHLADDLHGLSGHGQDSQDLDATTNPSEVFSGLQEHAQELYAHYHDQAIDHLDPTQGSTDF